METKLQQFLIDDLKKVEYHINELTERLLLIYGSETEDFKENMDEIEKFFDYWRQHAKIKTNNFKIK